jgi:outer membrane cobalamin receptor
MPYNVGKVQALGADVLGNVVYFTATGWMAGITVRYGYQKALDKTPDSYTFNQPIPYVAAHTLIINPLVAYKGWMLGATWNLRAGRRDSVGAMPNWNTVDIQFGKDFTLRTCTLGVRLTVRNLNNCRYETVSGYPMPGRSIMGGLVFNF